MANYDSNYAIAQEISARIGTSPIPFDSVYSIAFEIYNELGGEPAEFDSVYSILLGILPLVEGGIASKVIDDNSIVLDKTWSSSKINEEIQAVGGTADSEFDGKTTEDFRFVTELPLEATEGEQVIIKGENVDTLYKYVSGAWVEQTPDANILYFDTENEALYSYVTAEQQFATISSVSTIVVGKNLNTNEALKAIKTPGTYSVLQRTYSTTKGEYTKKWTLTVEGIDYEEYELTDSIYQRMQNNYTIYKRTWSSARATNDGWSNFSTYYAGEIKDTTTSKYYTWSSNKLNSQLSLKTNKSDYTIRTIVDSSYNLTFDLSTIDNVSTDGIYSVTIISDVTGEDKLIGVGDLIVFSFNMSGTSIVYQSLRITYAAEGTETIEITRKSLDGGQNWQDIMFANAVIDDIQNPSETLPYTTYSAKKINQLLSGKQDTLIAGTNIIISGNTISATDKTYSAGTGITISGNTISTIALTPTSGYNYATKYIDDDTNLEGTNIATGSYSNWAEGSKTTATSTYGGNHAEGYATSATGEYGSHSEGAYTESSGKGSHAEGEVSIASGDGSHAEGYFSTATGKGSHAEGEATLASGEASHAEGWGYYREKYPNNAIGEASHVEGNGTIARNTAEHAEGKFNVSHKSSNNMGDSGNTLSSIGFHIGDAFDSIFRNAREVMQNADMYIYGIGGYDGIHIKGEDSGITVHTVQEVVNGLETSVAGKQDTLIAGTGIEISGTTISAIYETASTADIEALFA